MQAFITALGPAAPAILAAIGAVAVMVVTEIGRRTGLATQWVLVGATALIGICYVAFERFVPPAVQEHVISFAAQAFVIQWALYEGIWKKVRQQLADARAPGFKNVE